MTAKYCSKVQHPQKTGLIIIRALTPLISIHPATITPAKSRLKLFDPTPFSVEFLAQHQAANDAHFIINDSHAYLLKA